MRTGFATAKRDDMYGNGLSGRKRTARRGGRRTVLHERTGLRVQFSRRTVLHRRTGLPVAIQLANCCYTGGLGCS